MESLEQLQQWDREHVWHASTQMQEYEPFLIESAYGCTLVDVQGREFLDGVSSLWCNVHGHRHPRLDAALLEQSRKVAHVTSLGMSNPTTVRLARKLVEISPDGLNHVFFSSDGACAIEVALKQAFQYWRQRPNPQPQKNRFVAFNQAYHGDTLGSVSVGGVPLFHAMFEPLLFEVDRLPTPDTYRLPPELSDAAVAGQVKRDEAACQFYLGQLETLLAEHHEQIAAVVIEPLVQGAAGMVMHPPGYLRGVRELTRRYDVLLIADEVAVGWGRTGKLFACEQEDVQPDFLCLGKGLTGGYLPLAATLSTDAIWDAFQAPYMEFKSFFHGHTYSGNPLSAAVALASIEVFEQERVLERMVPRVQQLQERLQRLGGHRHVGDVRQRGLMAAVELVADRESRAPFPAAERRGWRVCQAALEQGVWLRPLRDVLVIMPPLAITQQELDRLIDAVEFGLEATFP